MSEIYTASLFETFQSSLISVALVIGLGVLAIPMIFLGKRGLGSRFFIGVCSFVLIAAGMALASVTAVQYTSGSKVLTSMLKQKQVIETENSDGTGVTETYRLSFGPVDAFDVPQSIYEKLDARNCYIVTYYPSVGLMEMLGQKPEGMPITLGAVASIKQNAGGTCN